MAYYMNQARALLIFFLWHCIVEVLGPPTFSCITPPTIQNGYVSSSTSFSATYSCNTGYRLSGFRTAICEMEEFDLFYWDSIPTCIIVDCGPSPSISNGSPGTPTKTTFGGTGTYSCNTGYVLSGSSTVTCQASGSWSTIPTCQPICGSPPSISNGSPGTPTSIIQGGTVMYSCNSGYQLSGLATVVCQDSRNWSPRPNCLGISTLHAHYVYAFCCKL
ncbi:C4b-binding protein alpha chain-like [Halichondria panicea]|uniref:C4b-binding protein alpha chain-like n=1 Tax=Halichondria panicea TaxID=6063 RepID=UPI00312BB337